MGLLSRGLYALPILLPAAVMLRAMAMTGPIYSATDKAYSLGRYVLQDGTSVPVLRRLFGIPGLDDVLAGLTIMFGQLIFDDDPKIWWQCFVFLTDFASLSAILMLESWRSANRRTFFQTSVVPLFIAQLVALGNVAPCYFYLFYVFSPLDKYSTASARRIDGAGVVAILPTLLVVYFTPHLISLLHPDLQVRLLSNWYWQVFPIGGSVLLFALSGVVRLFLDDRTEAVQRRNKTGVRAVGGVMMTLSTMSYWCMLLCAPLPASELFIPKYFIQVPKDHLTAVLVLFQYDYIVSYTSVLLWLAYHFGDLKRAGICQMSWARILLSSIVIGCAGGPGVLVWVGWIAREDMMAFVEQVEHAKAS
ncbi:hypothetical protein Trco_002295 [Trichoderma cornu-damae]|uniref:Uncharacterized protein n=1 Tax=Trichoderma cornu-damae TaxID=654480 RepID=A0A9P8TYZ9_9HYPO|nr:hypothetical protein Trco_002295 [Trichoderma cornu-damae]